jgi:hypothetical protein
VAAAVVASFAVAAILSLVGYSDGASFSDVLLELIIAFSSYVTAALLVHWLSRSENISWEIVSMSLLGSAMSFPLKLLFLEGQNGIPAYVSRSSTEQLWQPFLDLLTHAALFICMTTLLALPFVAIVIVLWHLSNRLLARRNL